MTTQLVLPAELKGGRLRLNARQMAAWLKQRKDGPYTVTVERRHATRSTAQNAYYWSVVLALLAEHTGYTVDEMHEYCKGRFNAKRMIVTDENGEIKDESSVGLSTTTLNRLTFGEYMEQIRQWAAADLSVNIPDPDPSWKQPSDQVVG